MVQSKGVEVVSIEDDAYPRLLKETADPPVFLSYRGDLSVLDHPCVALVGSRAMSPYGERLAEWLTPDLVRAGCTTVSGLAFGVDAVVAQATLDHGGRTVAVLGSGLGAVSPKTNERLAEAIVKNGGLVASEYPFGDIGQPFMFPARNRVIAGLSLATVVVQAPAKSGALITARLALEDNREVLACPGPLFDPSMEGCNDLIADGHAQLLRSADDVLKTLGIVASAAAPDAPAPSFADPGEAAVHAALTTLPVTIDDLAERTGKPAGELAGILTMLELGGHASKVGAGWVRS
jgi:DNA processing protein